MATRILITGACGFAGAHIVEEALQYEDVSIIAMDNLTYAGRLDRLKHLDQKRIQFVFHDFRQPLSDALLKTIGSVCHIIHNGAESHVLRSFSNPRLFVESNVIGTMHMLEAARKLKPNKFLYVSTDEVFGPAVEQSFHEENRLAPTNPYAATKAGGELLAYSYYRSFGLHVMITRTMNMFGERQHPEKCIPLMIKRILNGQEVDIHADIEGIDGVGYAGTIGSRQWLHARTQASALMYLLRNGTPGQKYNIAGVKRNNLEIYQFIARTLNRLSTWKFAKPLGPIHDMDYSLDDSKIRGMGWKEPRSFEEALCQTVLWTAENPQWLEE